MPGLGSVFLRPGRKMQPKQPLFNNKPKALPVQKARAPAAARPILRARINSQKRRLLSREEQIRNSAVRAERAAIIRRVNVPFEQRLARVAADVKARKLSFDNGAKIIDRINLQREIALRRLGLK
ncbi:MAG: hypothetical protein Q7R70_00885 [Candidatus Diapherotrites archaeon]|nr:hypothetical protein [Candidatus Diapherotrites archaeon]